MLRDKMLTSCSMLCRACFTSFGPAFCSVICLIVCLTECKQKVLFEASKAASSGCPMVSVTVHALNMVALQECHQHPSFAPLFCSVAQSTVDSIGHKQSSSLGAPLQQLPRGLSAGAQWQCCMCCDNCCGSSQGSFLVDPKPPFNLARGNWSNEAKVNCCLK